MFFKETKSEKFVIQTFPEKTPLQSLQDYHQQIPQSHTQIYLLSNFSKDNHPHRQLSKVSNAHSKLNVISIKMI